MREHKYKALDKSSQEFISDNGLTFKEIQNINNLDHFEFYEYTGLKDKNGVEIYEGDIIIDHEHGVKDEVVFENGCFYGAFALYKCIVQGQVNVEVIGNIYENKELL